MSPAELQALRRRRADGESIASLAECFEVAPIEVIEATLRRLGNRPPWPSMDRAVEPEEIGYAVHRRGRGFTVQGIAQLLNIPETKLRTAAKGAGISLGLVPIGDPLAWIGAALVIGALMLTYRFGYAAGRKDRLSWNSTRAGRRP